MAFVLPASAGSVQTFNYSTSVSGVNNTTLTGSFVYDTSNDTFSTGSLSFTGNSVFGGLHGTYNKSESGDSFVLSLSASGITLQYNITLNPLNTNQYWVTGTITRNGTTGTFAFTDVPEGGARYAYLVPAGIVIFGGILLAGFKRRTEVATA